MKNPLKAIWEIDLDEIDDKPWLIRKILTLFYGAPILAFFLMGGWIPILYWALVIHPLKPQQRTKAFSITLWILAGIYALYKCSHS